MYFPPTKLSNLAIGLSEATVDNV